MRKYCLGQAIPKIEARFAGLFRTFSCQISAVSYQVLLIAIMPENQEEGSPGAQNGKGEGEEPVFEVLTPCGIYEESQRDGDGGQREKKGQDEHGFAPGF